jgi:hypothetical protein
VKVAGSALHNEPAFRKSFCAFRPHQKRDVTSGSQKPRAKISAQRSSANYQYPQDSSPHYSERSSPCADGIIGPQVAPERGKVTTTVLTIKHD